MSGVTYNSVKKKITHEGAEFDFYSGGAIAEELATVLVLLRTGNISLQDAWLRVKYLEDNM